MAEPLTQISSEGLQWVRKELASSVAESRVNLQRYIDDRSSKEPLFKVAELLHTVHGALRMVEVYGAAMLAEEMVTVVRHMHDNESGATEEALEATSRAIVQLPVYLDRIAGGGHDMPLILLPLLNDLRAVRGSPLLTESSLFVLNVDQGAATPERKRPAVGTDYRVVAQKLRPHYQKTLLGWLRGENADNNLKVLSGVVNKLEESAESTAIFQFWWVLGGVVEAVREGGLQPSAAVKRLLGQADQVLKKLAIAGEEQFTADPPKSLQNNLLYYVARADSSGEKVSAIKSSFSLTQMMQDDNDGTDDNNVLQAPSVDLMKTVAAAIKQDVGDVKDAIDIFVRTKSDNHESLRPQRESMKKLADTLGVLGLEELRQQVGREGHRLHAYIDDGKSGEEDLLHIAQTLISVESAIDEQLLGVIIPKQSAASTITRTAAEIAAESDQKSVANAVMRECVVNLSRVKEALSQYIDNPETAAALDGIPALIRGIRAGLEMLEKERASKILSNIEWQINAITSEEDLGKHSHELDRLADAIVSVEYYMETVRGGRSDPWYMLDNADTCLAALKRQPPADIDAQEEVSADVEPIDTGAPADATIMTGEVSGIFAQPTPAAVAASESVSELPHIAQKPAPAVYEGRLPPLDTPIVPMDGQMVDPELLELFIEEAKEEVVSLRRSLPRWRQDLADREVLLSMRRSFHTLKGSGRMVGANLLGEFAWGIENLVNKLVSQSIEPSEGIMQVLSDAVESIPALIEQLEVGSVAPQSLVTLTDKIWEIADSHGACLVAGADEGTEDSAAQATGNSLAEQQEEAEESAGPEADSDDLAAIAADDAAVADGEFEAITGDDEEAADFAHEPVSETSEDVFQTTSTNIVPGVVLEKQAVDEDWSDHKAAGDSDTPEAADPVSEEPEMEAVALLGEEIPEDVGRPAIQLEAALHEIFLKESLEHLGVVNAFIADVNEQIEPYAITENLHRAWHTLSGSANTASVSPAAVIATPVNEHLRGMRAEGKPLNREAIAIIERASAAFEEIVRGINVHTELPETAQLMADIDSLPSLGTAAKAAFEALDGTGEILQVAPTGPAYDPEIAGIFAEEAVELLDASDNALRDWFADEAHGGERIAELLRHLHTLKGGARMAGILAMGDLSHETESMVEQVRDGERTLNESDKGLIQASIDHMHAMAEELGKGTAVTAADELISRLRGEVTDTDSEVQERSEEPAVTHGESDESIVHEQVAEPEMEQQDEGDRFVPAAAAEYVEESVAPVVADTSAQDVAQELAALPALARTGAAKESDDKPIDIARIDARLLDEMLNNAGEVSIFHSRLEEQVGSISFNLTEFQETVARLREQLRKLEFETEAQIVHKHQDQTGAHRPDFDPLELDRYSELQQLSRALAESVSDLVSLKDLMTDITRESESLLVQQARVTGELQDALIRSRMLPFEHYVPRFERIVRQTAQEQHNQAALTVSGGSGELDRQVLQRMLPPFEHMLRNAVIHGIESPQERRESGKPEQGNLRIDLVREGAEMVIEVRDDGRGLNTDTIRAKARAAGLLRNDQDPSDQEIMELILTHGFSTAGAVTQSAGRGVGMDVVSNEVKMLGGSLQLESEPGKGTTVIIRLPLTLAVSQALLVRCGDERFAIPLPAVESIVRVQQEEIARCLEDPQAHQYSHNGIDYRVAHLGPYLGASTSLTDQQDGPSRSVILVRAGENSTAFLVDELLGSREVVVKSAGPMVSSIPGITGATILGDGSIVVILDIAALIRNKTDQHDAEDYVVADTSEDLRPVILVVDDSITVRRVTQRLLERNNMRVILAKDGVDAVAVMQEIVPHLILLDIEMPRMDGYEVASHIRNTETLQHIPITMITSRVGEKHRARAFELGVDKYLGKPYQENQLLDVIQPLLARSLKQRS